MTTETTQPAETSSRDMSPAAAVARHLAWLEDALIVAREEETRRRGRLERATDRNRDKRTVRLAEVTDEVAELEALVAGIKALQARPARAGTRTPAAPRASKPRRSTAQASG